MSSALVRHGMETTAHRAQVHRTLDDAGVVRQFQGDVVDWDIEQPLPVERVVRHQS